MDYNGNDTTTGGSSAGGDSAVRIKPVDNIIISQEATSGEALPSNSSGNVILGFAAGVLTTSNSNVFIGKNVGKNTVGNGTNTAVGTSALRGSTSATVSGNGNTAIGQQAMREISGGDDNTCVGKQAARSITSGVKNTCIGEGVAINTLTNENGNTLLGSDANLTDNVDYAIAIGASATVNTSNTMCIGGSSSQSRINSIYTGATSTCDLGSTSRKFKDIHLSGSLVCGSNNTVVNFSSTTPGIGDVLRAGSTTVSGWEKRVMITQITNQGTYTPNVNVTDQLNIIDQAQAFTIANPTGSPSEAQRLTIRAKCDGTNRGITWGNIYRPMGIALPSTLVSNKSLYLGLIYNGADTKWDLVSSSQQA